MMLEKQLAQRVVHNEPFVHVNYFLLLLLLLLGGNGKHSLEKQGLTLAKGMLLLSSPEIFLVLSRDIK